MIPYWFERLCLLGLLLLAIWLRAVNLRDLPPGFSDDELESIDITEQIRNETVRVFFPLSPEGGQESLYQTLNTGMTMLVGDGLLGYRLLGFWCNLLALAFLYAATRALVGPGIALMTLAIMVTGIWSVILSRSVTALTMVPLFVSGTLALVVWTFRLHKPIAPTLPLTTRYTTLGVWIGAAIYAHYTGLLLALVLLIFIIYLARTNQPVSRRVWSSSLFTVTLILVLALPYMISVLRNPDLTSLHLLWRRHPKGILDFLDSILKSLGGFALRGDSNPTHNVPALPLLWPIWFLLALMGLSFAVRRWREPAYGLLLIMLVVGVVPDVWLTQGPDFAAMLLVQPVLFIMAGLGTYVAAQYAQQTQVIGGWRFVAVLAALGFAFTLWQTYDRLLNDWSAREDVRSAYHADVAQLAAYLDTSTDDSPVLFCVENLYDSFTPDGRIRWSEPRIAGYMLHREDYNMRFAVCRSAFVLIGGGEPMRILMVNPRNVNEAAPPIRTWFEQTIPLDDLPLGTGFELEAVDELAQLGGQWQLATGLQYPHLGSEAETAVLPVRFGRNITLLGYIPPEQQPYHPNSVIVMTTYWRIDGEPPSRLGVFIRLHDIPQYSPYTETNVLDVIPIDLQERDVIIQTSFMPIPDTLLPGEYVLTLGIYDNNPLNQIRVFGQDISQERGDYLILEPRIMVEEKPEE